jgi:uncharacterized protein YkwD
MRSKNNLKSATTVDTVRQSSYRGTVGNAKPEHYYQIRLNQRSSLNLSLSGLRADAQLALLNRNGKILNRSVRQQKNGESIVQTVNPGTYYVRVYRQQGKTQYKLTIDQRPTEQTTAKSTATLQQNLSLRNRILGNPLGNQILKLVNQYRRQAKLRPLKLNAQLNASAQAHSQDMALNDFFGHKGSNGSTADKRILAAGYNYAIIGENIAAGFASPEAVVQAWMDSPSHRQNILHPMMKEMGIGFYLLENDGGNVDYRYYWAQNFGKPISGLSPRKSW